MQTYEQELHGSESIADRARRDTLTDRSLLQDTYRKMGEELAFALEQKQYKEQSPDDRGDANQIWPTDQGLFRLLRYKKAMIRKSFPLHIQTEPRDQVEDPTTAVWAKRVLESDLIHDRQKMYSDTRDRWLMQALAMRAGCYRIEYDGYLRQVLTRLIDPRNISWPKGYLTPHDPLNPRVSEVFRMPINQARRNAAWKYTGDLKPDAGLVVGEEGVAVDDSNVMDDQWGDEGFFTGAAVWYRFEDNVPQPHIKLDPLDRFMKCTTCDFTTPPLGDVPEQAQGFEYPATLAGGCPLCGQGEMVRQDTQKLDEPGMNAIDKGKRLVIISLGAGPEGPLFDGPWPCPKARTFPYAWLTPYKFPHMRFPESDVSLNWTVTLGRNFTLAVIYRQAHRARGLWLLPELGLTDRNGFRFDFGDDQDDCAFYDALEAPQGVQNIAAPPLNASLFELHALLEGAFRTNEGSSDVAIDPSQRSLDVPVGSLQQLTETGNVPIDDFGQDVHESESLAVGVYLDYARWFWPDSKMVRYYGDDGVLGMKALRQEDIPNADVIISSGPQSLSPDKAEALELYQKLYAMPGPRRRRIGQIWGMDPALLNQMDQDDKAVIRWQAELDAEAQKVRDEFAPPTPGMPQQLSAPMNGAGNGALPAAIAARMGANGSAPATSTEGAMSATGI